jgi:hypothetical protein
VQAANNSRLLRRLEPTVAQLKDKLENALNEARILILGAQVLIGADYRSYFDPGFSKLPTHSQMLDLFGLGLMLVGLCLLISPAAFHRIVSHGESTSRLHDYVTTIITFGLLPFALGIGIECFVALEKLVGFRAGVIGGVLGFLLAMFFWYGLEVVHRTRKEGRLHLADLVQPTRAQMPQEPQETPLSEKIKEVLIEARMVLPGAQALLGFQFTVFVMEGFDRLPQSSKYVHFASLACIAISTILLITPAAYHRIVESGEDSEDFHDFASRMLLAAMVWLALGLCGDFFVVCRKVTQSTPVALASALTMLVIFYGLWFGYMWWRKQQPA